MSYSVPAGYWQQTCEDIDYPLACVSTSNKFIWVNSAFERLTGYSVAELFDHTWMSITDQKDVGGDLESVEAVITGKITHYTMSKDYRHKRGHLVPVDLTVRRFPTSRVDDLICFIVECPPAKATKPELDQVELSLNKKIDDLNKKIEHNEKGISIIMGNKDGGHNHNIGGDYSGRDKINNSDSAIKILGISLGVVAIVIAWLFYYITVANKDVNPTPPPTISGQNL